MTGKKRRMIPGKGLTAAALSLVLAAECISPAMAGEPVNDVESSKEPGVIVMFEGQEDLTKKEVRTMLGKGKDSTKVTVEDVWNFEGEDMSIALVTSNTDPDVLAAKLEKRSDVKFAEKDSKIHLASVTKDTYSDLQWSMQNTDVAPKVQASWDTTGVSGSEYVVAVCDTGVDYEHPDLKDNIWTNPFAKQGLKGTHGYDFISGDADPMDENGHGSHCAGIIGATGDNGVGISGVNKKVKIMALRILDAEGSAYLSHEIAAYHYINKAMDLGVPVVAINNSWGGGSYSEIFDTLVEKVGKKGAITVCAAGNEASDLPSYPVAMGNPYMISVGATNESGNLVSFSNYGDWVDVAAPGTDILSTVCYDCYNPGIYGENQDAISERFNDFETGDTELIPDEVYVNGNKLSKKEVDGTSVFADEKGRKITISVSENGFLSDKAVSVSMNGIKEKDLVCVPVIKYTNDSEKPTAPHCSFMSRGKCFGDADGGLSLLDVKADTKFTEKDMEAYGVNLYLDNGGDYWGHVDLESVSPEKGTEERQYVLALSAGTDGDFRIDLDNIGLSRQDLKDTSAFGKYDYYSGTSMASPYIAGSVALLRAQKAKAGVKSVNALDLINEMTGMHKATPQLEIGEKKGSFDFTVKPVSRPRIGNVAIEKQGDKNMISITGSGLDVKAADFAVEITKNNGFKSKSVKVLKAADVKGDSHAITFADNGWANNILDLTVKANGKTATLTDLYMVNGKKTYVKSEKSFTCGENYVTDGKRLYWYDQETGSISYCDPEDETDCGAFEIPETLFGEKKKDDREYGFACGPIAYLNGMLYAVGEYGAADMTESGDKIGVYDGKQVLIRIDTVTGAPQLCTMPDLGNLEEFTLGAYNGKLYLMGGYQRAGSKKKASAAVKVYDPVKNAWSESKALPETRYGGKALQTGNKLIYTLGYASDEQESDLEYAANLIFDGANWKVSKAGTIKALAGGDPVGVGIVKGGLVYAGLPAEDLGDTFLYDSTADTFKDTGYNLNKEVFSLAKVVVPARTAVYALLEGDEEGNSGGTLEMPIQNGFVNIKQNVTGSGLLTCPVANPPGNDIRVTAQAFEGNVIGSLTVDGKNVAVPGNATTFTYTIPNLMKDAEVSVVFEEEGYEYVLDANTLTVKGKTLKVNLSKIGKKGFVIKKGKAYKFTDMGQGELTYKLSSATKATAKAKKNKAKGASESVAVKLADKSKKDKATKSDQKSKKKDKKITKTSKSKNKKDKKNTKKKKTTKSYKKYFKVNENSGKITVKKGIKKGTYKLKIKVMSSGDEYTESASKKVTVTVKIQ
ncbi:MAG: S8 family serine peptidase [Lachnospiraceae bacterium]|nr:S8 family serine peptidase [Lachnospiraceae bacterium]